MEFLSKSGLSFFKSLLDLYFATKAYVNKAISTNTGKFWGTYNSLADLQEITGSNGDYAYVIVPDDYSTSYDRYKWQDGQWVYEYTVGGEAFDDDQWAAINSGITASDKARLNEISENIGNQSISEMRSDIDANASEIEEINEELGDIDAALANKANVDGYYESMAVGQADNLKGQVLIPNDEAFRTSGGSADVDTGLAHLQNVKGNTVSWNSLILNGNFDDLSYWRKYDSNVEISVSNNKLSANWTSPYSNNGVINTAFRYSAGHIYAVFATVKNTSEDVRYYGFGQPYGAKLNSGALLSGEEKNIRGLIAISQSSGSGFELFTVFGTFDVYNSLELSRVVICDLTLIYGAGNEPTSVEQFETDYEKWFGKPLTYEPYNAGELIPAKTTALKTTGFNQWDEVWEVGDINATTGNNEINGTLIRTKNFIPIIGGQEYYCKVANLSTGQILRARFYDANKNYIGYPPKGGGTVLCNSTFTPLDTAHFLRFAAPSSYGNTYNHDICINLSHSGTRNGEYEPYEEHTLQLPLTTLTGKLNGAGESVVVFPDGMHKFDRIYTSGGKTYGEVGGETRAYQSGDATSETMITDGHAYTYVKLSTPNIYELDNFTLPQTFRVNDWGTEEQIHAEGVSSVPALLNSLYAVNAVDTIRRLPQNYISQESMDNFLAQLGAAMGGTWTKSFNTETNEFEFSFVQSSSLMSVSNNEETNNEEE